MTCDQIIAGLRALTEEDFHRNRAIGIGKLYDLTDALEKLPNPGRAIPEMFAVMERLPEADMGAPGLLVFALESMDYEEALIASLQRRATWSAVDMVHRILNSELPPEKRRFYRELLALAIDDPAAHESASDHAEYVLEQHGGED